VNLFDVEAYTNNSRSPKNLIERSLGLSAQLLEANHDRPNSIEGDSGTAFGNRSFSVDYNVGSSHCSLYSDGLDWKAIIGCIPRTASMQPVAQASFTGAVESLLEVRQAYATFENGVNTRPMATSYEVDLNSAREPGDVLPARKP
jgi:hypothetical protein